MAKEYQLSDYEEEIVEEDKNRDYASGRPSYTGRWIRNYLTFNQESDYIGSMYRQYKRFVEHFLSFDPPTYQSFARYMRKLRDKDLVVHVDTKKADGPDFLASRKYYSINTEKRKRLGDKKWKELFDSPFSDG